MLFLVAPLPVSGASTRSDQGPAEILSYNVAPAPVVLVEHWTTVYPPLTKCRVKLKRSALPQPKRSGVLGIRELSMAALAILLASSIAMASAQTTQAVDVDYTPGEVVASIATGCGLLNIVSININQVSSQLLTIDRLMSKRNWHIVLVQETGVVGKTTPNPHVALRKSMHHSIFFNSPHHAHLQHKQYDAKVRELALELQEGVINPLQYNTQVQLAKGRRVYPSGGMAVVVNRCVVGTLTLPPTPLTTVGLIGIRSALHSSDSSPTMRSQTASGRPILTP